MNSMIQEDDIQSERGKRRLNGVTLGHVFEDIAKDFVSNFKFCVGFGVDS